MTPRILSAMHPLAALCLVATLLTGCASGTMIAYDGPPLTRERVAVIKSSVSGFVGGMTASAAPSIVCVDGKEVRGDEVQVLPGRHRIQISLFVQASSRNFRGDLEFEAEANHEYLAHGGVATGLPLIWLEDKTAKQIVARGAPTDQSFRLIQCR